MRTMILSVCTGVPISLKEWLFKKILLLSIYIVHAFLMQKFSPKKCCKECKTECVHWGKLKSFRSNAKDANEQEV